MIFEQWQRVLDGTKTQTRRLVKEGDTMLFLKVLGKIGRLRWEIDRIYAVQSGRGRKAVGRIRITEIRCERLQSISEADAEAEGICLEHNRSGDRGWSNGLDGLVYPRREWAFEYLWNSINKKPGTRWMDNPEVWVLTFGLDKRV